MDFKLELVVLPVADVDRAKAFYLDQLGFRLDVDYRAGSVGGLHLMVSDCAAARAELVGRGVPVSEPFHFGAAGQTPGPDPERRDYGTFLSFADPDGNGWLVQEIPSRA